MASACAGPWLSTATATVPRPHTRCVKLPGHKERNPKIPLRQLKSYELKYSTVPCQASECPSELNPRADAVGGKALGFPSGSVCGDGSGSREKGRWPARKTTSQPGRPGPTAPGSTLVSAWQTRPSASHNPGEGRRAWGTATCNSRPTVGGEKPPGPAAHPAEQGPRSEKCPLPCSLPHAWDSRHRCTRVPHGCSLFSGASEPQGGEGLQKEESCLAQRMQYFPEDSPGSAGGALAEHV